MSTWWIGDRKPDRYVPGFGGRMNAIYSPVGTPKPREECQPFTFILHDPSGHRDDSRNHRRFTPEQNIKAQVTEIYRHTLRGRHGMAFGLR